MTTIRQNGNASHRQCQTESGIKITTFIPLKFKRHGNRKVVVRPDGTREIIGVSPQADEVLVRALARSIFWQRLLDEGKFGRIADLAEKEDIDKTRMAKLLKLSRLAPDIVEAIAKGKQPLGLTLEKLIRRDIPVSWAEQREMICNNRHLI